MIQQDKAANYMIPSTVHSINVSQTNTYNIIKYEMSGAMQDR